MKNYLVVFSIVLLCFGNTVFAQHYSPVAQNSVVQFKVSHQMIFKSTVTGTFSGLKGSIVFDPNDLAQSSFVISIAAETIDSGIGMRDNDLKKDKYFDVLKYPFINIQSSKISRGASGNSYIFSGMLTMKGVTKNISFPFTAKAVNGGYVFTGSFDLNRLEYNIGPDNSIAKNVEVDLSVLAR